MVAVQAVWLNAIETWPQYDTASGAFPYWWEICFIYLYAVVPLFHDRKRSFLIHPAVLNVLDKNNRK